MHYYCTNVAEGVSELGFEKHSTLVIPKDAVMCVCIGNTIGKCAIASEPSITNQQINTVIANEKNDAKFIYYLLCSNRERIRAVGLGGGAAQPIINKTKFSALDICVPQLSVQKAISEKLSAYDDLIENNRRRIGLLEEAARLLYREWFVYFRFPGHEHVKITNGLPEGWEPKKISQLVTTQYGHTASATLEPVGPKFLRGMDINKNSYIDWDSVPYCPDRDLRFEHFELKPDDIVVTCSNQDLV